jgi:hypothetical protein
VFIGTFDAEKRLQDLPDGFYESVKNDLLGRGVLRVFPASCAKVARDGVYHHAHRCKDGATSQGQRGVVLCTKSPESWKWTGEGNRASTCRGTSIDLFWRANTLSHNQSRQLARNSSKASRWQVWAICDIAVVALVLLGALPGSHDEHLFPDYLGESLWRRRLIGLWWLSWLAWAIAWIRHRSAKLIRRVNWLRYPILFADNLNTVLVLLFYLALTRGQRFSRTEVIRSGQLILLSLGVFYLALYGVIGKIFADQTFAYELHRAWSLCFAVFAMIVLGWVFAFASKPALCS